MRTLLIASLLLTGVELGRLPAAEGDLLFSDDFATLDPGWGKPAESESVDQNKLKISLKPQIRSRRLYSGKTFGDVDVRLKVVEVGGELNQPAGIVFWGTDLRNYYAALIQADGTCTISRQVDGRWLTPVSYSRNEVRQGLGSVNDLRVVTSGSQVTMYVNNRLITSLRGFPPPGPSKVGVHAESGKDPAQWEFSELRVLEGPADPRAGQPQDDSLLFADDFAALDATWGLPSDDLKVEDHRLLLGIEPGMLRRTFYDGSFFGDADVRVTISQVSGGTDQRLGLIFWGENINNCYEALIRSDGQFSVVRKMNGKDLFPVTLAPRSELRTGLGAANELRVVTSGRTATIYVNDRQVASFPGSPPANGGRIGLRVGAGTVPTQCAFSGLSVRKGPALDPSQAPHYDKLLLASEFDAFDPQWGSLDESRVLKDGFLQYTLPPNKYRRNLYQGSLFGDADISTNFAQKSGDADQPTGIMFWAADYANYYAALLRSDGKLVLRRYREGKELTIGEPIDVDEEIDGEGLPNELRVVTRGDSAEVFINNESVATLSKGAPPQGGSLVGLHVESGTQPAVWSFSNFTVVKPEPAAATPAATPPPERSLPYVDDFVALDPGWGRPSKDFRVEGGRLLVTVPDDAYLVGRTYIGAKVKDADLRATFTRLEGAEADYAGLLFWAEDVDTHYVAVIRADGKVAVYRRMRDQMLVLRKFSVAPAARTGTGQANELRVVTTGDVATVYVNDQRVVAFRGHPSDAADRFGVVVSADEATSTWAVSQLNVRRGPASAAPPADAPLYADDFAVLDPAWSDSDKVSVAGGKLELRPDSFKTSRDFYNGTLFDDVDLRVTVAQGAGEDLASAGVMFWGTDYENYYFAQVHPDGRLTFGRESADRTFEFNERGQEFPAVRKGAPNELRVVTSGDRAEIHVNGQKVAAFLGFPPAAGQRIGVIGDSNQEPSVWRYSGLTVRRGPPPSSAPRDPAVLFADDFATLDPAWRGQALAVQDHKLIATSRVNGFDVVMNQGATFGDADIRVDLSIDQQPGPGMIMGGLVFWGDGPLSYSTLLLQPDGTVRVVRRTRRGRPDQPLSIAGKQEVRVGVDKVNALRVVTRGKTATLYLNGQELGSFEGEPPEGGGLIGIYSSARNPGDRWIFSNLVVRKPEGAAPAK